MFEIVDREELAQGTIISNWVKAPKIAQKAKPGQFVILRANDKGERIPLTMADTDTAKGLINIIYMVVGKSTALFKTLQVGDSYLDVIGPLGQPTHLEKEGTVVCVGGGTGVAYGTVTGYGSVIINGVHYEDNGVSITRFDDSTVRVAPPSTNSRARLWP